MTQARKLARDVARATARKKWTKFDYEFDRIWHQLNGYPRYINCLSVTKKTMRGGKKRGITRGPYAGRACY